MYYCYIHVHVDKIMVKIQVYMCMYSNEKSNSLLVRSNVLYIDMQRLNVRLHVYLKTNTR